MVHRSAPDRLQLGRAIRALREARGMTIEGLAREARVDVAHLSRAENHGRNFTWETLTSIAEVLDVPLSSLVSKAEEIADRDRATGGLDDDRRHRPGKKGPAPQDDPDGSPAARSRTSSRSSAR